MRNVKVQKYNFRAILRLLIFLFIGLEISRPALPSAAQIQDNRWAPPWQVSSQKKNADDGYLASDPYGGLHMVWIERIIGGGSPVIQYAHLDERGWSQPVDIYAAPQGSELESISIAADPQGEIHLAWTETGFFRQRPVFYTHAPAYAAGSARNWAEPQRISIPAHLICLQGGPEGEVRLFYSKYYEPQTGIYATEILDQGADWTEPEWLDPDIPLYHTPVAMECAGDGLGNYHLIWAYTATVDTVDWIRYAAYRQAQGWSLPVTIDQDLDNSGRLRAAGPRIAVYGETVHLVWASELQRLHRYSTDMGRSWNVPQPFLSGLDGQAQDGIAVDGAGNLHYLSQLRYPRAIYHTRWLGDHWDIPSLVYLISLDNEDLIGNRIHAHHIHAAFRMGNELVITFTDPPAEPARRLFVTQRYFPDIPAISPLNTPTPEETDTSSLPLPALGAGTNPTQEILPTQSTPATAAPTSSFASKAPPPGAQNPNTSLMIGTIAGGLFIILITAVYLLRPQIKHLWNNLQRTRKNPHRTAS